MAIRGKVVDLAHGIRDIILQFSQYQHVRRKMYNDFAEIADPRN